MKLIKMTVETIQPLKKERYTITIGDSIDQFNLELQKDEWLVMYRRLSRRTINAPNVRKREFPLEGNRDLIKTDYTF